MAAVVITLDTSGLLALINTGDRDHAACRAVFERDGGPFIIPVATLSEIAWTLETKLHSRVEDSFLDDLADEVYTLDWHQRDVPRVRELSRRYRDLRLGIADAAVIACAEPHGGRVLTTDRRHFPVVARGERTITVLPD